MIVNSINIHHTRYARTYIKNHIIIVASPRESAIIMRNAREAREFCYHFSLSAVTRVSLCDVIAHQFFTFCLSCVTLLEACGMREKRKKMGKLFLPLFVFTSIIVTMETIS
jgi:hypothetical protein